MGTLKAVAGLVCGWGLVACGANRPLSIAQLPPDPAILAVFAPPVAAPYGFAGGGTVSADGRYWAYQSLGFGSFDIWLLDSLTGMIDPMPNLNTNHQELMPVISEDGRWITFASDRSGGWDLFVYDRGRQTYRPLTFNSYLSGGISPFASIW